MSSVTPLSMVKEEEMKAIECQINNYADEPLNVSVPYLLREWDSTKGYLFKNVFNSESLILSRHVSFTKNEQQIATDIGDAWDRSLPEGGRLFYHQFHEFCAQMRREISQKLRESGYDPFITGMYSEELEKPANQWWRCQDILDTQVLAANEIQEEFTIDLPKPDGTFRKYHVQKGSRPMRVVGRILKAYHFAKEEDYKELVNWHSRMLNDKRLEGELCLSIHPLDYMTMSENNCDWTSCMNWPEGGCYRGGTIEMMNSPMVIVAYLKSANNPLMMDCGWDYSTGTGIHNRLEWNSKKWRILICVNESGIYSVKGYPYYHKELTETALNWVASLLKDRHFETCQSVEPYCLSRYITEENDLYIEYNPSTYRMYNDFGSSTHHVMFDFDYLRANYDKDKDNSIFIPFCYSGASECMSCGALSYRDDGKGVYFDGEGQLICTSCGGYEDSTYCDNCGERFNSEDGVWVEDEYLCPDCFEDQCFEDEWTHEYHYINDAIQTKVYVTPNNGEPQWYDVGLLWVPHLEELIKDEKLANNLRNMSSVKLKASQFNKDGMYYYNETKRRLERWNSWRF